MSALQEFGEGLWTADGPDVAFFFFPYPTRMAVARLTNGDLWIWSPVALTPELKRETDALGRVAHLVSPNLLHHLFLNAWKSAYPAAKLYGPADLARRKRNIAFDVLLGDKPDPAWNGEIDLAALSGNVFMTEYVFFHRASRTAMVADYVQNFRPGRYKGWRGWLARMDGLVQPQSSAPRELRITYWNRRAGRAALARILAWQPEKVVVAHGELVPSGGGEFIRHGFRWLLG